MKREDMRAAASFRAECCRCGKRQPRKTTQHTVTKWMQAHEKQHAYDDKLGNAND